MRTAMEVPSRWRCYDCADYDHSPLAANGWWNERARCWYVEPSGQLREDAEREFLVIGRPGVDGIEWAYRRGRRGVWAYYPFDVDFVNFARSASELLDSFRSGTTTV